MPADRIATYLAFMIKVLVNISQPTRKKKLVFLLPVHLFWSEGGEKERRNSMIPP